jgi:hypothetical protein
LLLGRADSPTWLALVPQLDSLKAGVQSRRLGANTHS